MRRSIGAGKLVGEIKHLRDLLWKNRAAIVLAMTVLIALALAATTYYYYRQSNDRAAQLVQKESEYGTLDKRYGDLSGNFTALDRSYVNLSASYDNLSSTYDSLYSEDSSLRSSYEGLNGSVSNFTEAGGPVVALYYRKYYSGAGSDRKLVVDATAYNVGQNKASTLTIKCRVLFDGTLSENFKTFNDVASLEKRHVTWEFQDLAQLDSVWVEY